MLAGLVDITPAAGYVSYFSAFIISFAGGIVCYLVINVIKVKYKYNDTLDAFGIHGAEALLVLFLPVFFNHNMLIMMYQMV